MLNILVAEDDDQNQAVMKLILHRDGHHVKSAWNGRSALEAVKSENFDLVFMDVHMPEMDGLEVTRLIREWENNKRHTPIVLITGSIPQKIAEEYKKVGADTYLLKPFDVKRISLVVKIFTEETEAGYQQESNQNLETPFEDLPLVDIDDALPRFNQNTKLYFENLQEFLLSFDERSNNLLKASKDQNLEVLEVLAHNLKGVAANFGAKQLAALSASLEIYCQDKKVRFAKKTLKEIIKNIGIIQAVVKTEKFMLDLSIRDLNNSGEK